MNQAKTFLLMLVLTIILVALGGIIGGSSGAQIAFVIALAMNFISYWFCDKIVLAMYGAHQVSEAEAPQSLPGRCFSVPKGVGAHAQSICN